MTSPAAGSGPNERDGRTNSQRELRIWLALMLGWFVVIHLCTAVTARVGAGAGPAIYVAMQVMGIVFAAVHLRVLRRSPASCGLTLAGARMSLLRGLGTGVALAALALATRLVLEHQGVIAPGAPLLRFAWNSDWAFYLLLGVPLQELCFRGMIQSFVRDLHGGGRAGQVAAVLVATVSFSAGHLFWSLEYAAATVVPSLVWGAQFERDRTLVGVTLSHALVGWFAFSLLPLEAA